MTKSHLSERPVFHREEDAIDAHLTVVFAAFGYRPAFAGVLWDECEAACRRLEENSLGKKSSQW